MDKQGYIYFVDRIGDTFRWKGENVATSEVSQVIAKCPGLEDCNVYGIALDKYDGRVGMAAIMVKEDFDYTKLYTILEDNLPVYARPYFLRILQSNTLTGTFKHKKVNLRKEGIFGEDKSVYRILDSKHKTFRNLTEEDYHMIENGTLRM